MTLPSLIDSHCHIPFDPVSAARLISEAKSLNVEKLINIGTSVVHSEQALTTAIEYEGVYSTVAIYPHDDKHMSFDEVANFLEKFITRNLSTKKLVAVGETGVDISTFENGRSIEDQLKIFELHIEASLKHNLPLVIHNRNGDEQVLKTLRSYKTKNSALRGVAHCFSSTLETAQQFIELGFYISFAGNITYPSATDRRSIVSALPLDSILVETDSPYLAPQGYRGKENEPKYVRMVAEKIAEVQGKPLEEVARVTYANTCQLFAI